MDTSHLREGDVDLMLRLVEDAAVDAPSEAMPWSVLETLQRLVPCDFVSYQELDVVGRRALLFQDVERDGTQVGPEYPTEEELADDEQFWEVFWDSHCSWPERTGDLVTVTHTADFYPTRACRRAQVLHEVVPDIEHQLRCCLPAAPGRTRRILFFRSADDPFTDRDRQVLQLLRPHLEDAWQAAVRRRSGVPELTSREWEVLALVASGLSYDDAARALHLSSGTVRKHMENVRGRLGVHSARAAAALAMPHAPGRVAPHATIVT